jgi:hypothetical protein
MTPLTFSFDAFGFDIDYQVSEFINDGMTFYQLHASPGWMQETSLPLNAFLLDKCTKLTKIDVVSAAAHAEWSGTR